MPDKYCYAGTHILKNKLEIRNEMDLFNAEIEFTSIRLTELQNNPISGNFGFRHLCRIHEHIFKDLYTWAGKPRTVAIAKNSLFCLPEYITSYASEIFPAYYEDCHNKRQEPHAFRKTLAAHYADLNALHPFREGNGRTQREFARELCLKCGYMFDLLYTSREEMLSASILSLDKGDNSELERIFEKTIIPMDEYIKEHPLLNMC